MQDRLGNRERWFRSGGGTEREIFGGRRYEDLFPETSRLTLPDLDARWRREAVRILAEHPVLAAAAAARGAALLLLTPPSFIFGVRLGFVTPGPELLEAYENVEVTRVLALLRAQAPALLAISLVLTLLLVALWAAAAGGVRASWREIPAPVHAALLGTFLYVVAVSSGAESGDDRYRLPLVPIAAVYAARRLSAP
jgi:hypothetical protein